MFFDRGVIIFIERSRIPARDTAAISLSRQPQERLLIRFAIHRRVLRMFKRCQDWPRWPAMKVSNNPRTLRRTYEARDTLLRLGRLTTAQGQARWSRHCAAECVPGGMYVRPVVAPVIVAPRAVVLLLVGTVVVAARRRVCPQGPQFSPLPAKAGAPPRLCSSSHQQPIRRHFLRHKAPPIFRLSCPYATESICHHRAPWGSGFKLRPSTMS